MNHLDFLLAEIKTFEKYIETLPFKVNDVRRDYYNMTKNIMASYYRKYTFLLLSKSILEGHVHINKEIDISIEHFHSLGIIWLNDVTVFDFRNNINRSFITDYLSIFETTVSTILDNILSDHEKRKLLGKRYKHISNIGVRQKWNKFYDFIDLKYQRDIEEDKQFLNFFAAYRNSMHSNMVFYGKDDFTYSFDGIKLFFCFGKSVTQSHDFGIDWHFKLGTNLVTILTTMIFALDYKEFIPYPDMMAP